LILVIHTYIEKDPASLKKGALLTIFGGILLGCSQLVQYGVLLHGEKGFSIPIGIPIILVIGWWMYREDF